MELSMGKTWMVIPHPRAHTDALVLACKSRWAVQTEKKLEEVAKRRDESLLI